MLKRHKFVGTTWPWAITIHLPFTNGPCHICCMIYQLEGGFLYEVLFYDFEEPKWVWDLFFHCHYIFLISNVNPLLVFAGYGHLSPATEGGQLFLIFYAFLGIPLSLVFLAYVGVRICNLHQKLLKCIKCFKNPRLNNLLDTTVMVVLGITLFILVPAGIFHHMEGWSFITSCYFCVVTLSTIGFGDYVTGTAFNIITDTQKSL